MIELKGNNTFLSNTDETGIPNALMWTLLFLAIATAALILIGLCLCRRFFKKKKNVYKEMNSRENNYSVITNSLDYKSWQHLEISPHECVVDHHRVLDYLPWSPRKGVVRDVDVAVFYYPYLSGGSESTEELLNKCTECKILVRLQSHPNIINLIATSFLSPRESAFMCFEYCKYGSLKNYLRRSNFVSKLQTEANQADIPESFIYDDNETFNVSENCLIEWCIQLSKALQHLETNGVIHNDIAARNIMLDKNKQIKLSDFWSAKLVENSSSGKYTGEISKCRPLKWMAIESLQESEYSYKTDIWAFGVTMWEIFSLGEVLFKDISNSDFIQSLINGLRLPKATYASDDLYDLMKNCWNLNPEDRPSAYVVEEILSELLRNDQLLIPAKNCDVLQMKDMTSEKEN